MKKHRRRHRGTIGTSMIIKRIPVDKKPFKFAGVNEKFYCSKCKTYIKKNQVIKRTAKGHFVHSPCPAPTPKYSIDWLN